MKMNDAICRPKEITSDAIWELYKMLRESDSDYLCYDKQDKEKSNERLYYVREITLGDDGLYYSNPDSLGVEFPESKNEWIEISLSDIENGKYNKETVIIKVNALSNDKDADSLMKFNGIRIPVTKDLKDAVYFEEVLNRDEPAVKIPVNDYPVPIKKADMKKGEKTEKSIRKFREYLRFYSIPFKEDVDNNVKRFTFVFMCDDVPGGFLEGCVWFYNKAAEVRVYYNSLGSDICKKSEHIGELYRLLNFINARVFMSCKGVKENSASNMLYTPRIYLTEDDGFDISITTMINYDFWLSYFDQTHDYITAYCPDLLNMLSPYITGLLTGEMRVAEAIDGVSFQCVPEI